MKEIYTKADRVVIIDSGLSACCDATDTLEILARFRLSNWIRRLWTIQEGLFASSLYLLVGSTPISLSLLIAKVISLPRNGFQHQIGLGVINNYEEVFGLAIFRGITSKAEIPANTAIEQELTKAVCRAF